jgi:bile acid:Na+ symporter, BASS family
VTELILQVLVVVFTAGSLLGVGLTVTPRALLVPLRHAQFIVLTFIVGWVVCPVIARLLLRMIPLDRPYAAGLLLLALAPAAPFAPAMMDRARADPAYVAGFMVLTAVGTVLIMPLAVPFLIEGVHADPLALARPLILFVLLPMLAGLAARHVSPDFAERARHRVASITAVTGMAVLVIVVFLHGRAVLNAVGSFAIATQTAFVAVVTVITQALGFGLRGEQRSVLTLGMCTRNLGAALAPLAAVERDPRAIVMIAVAAPVTLIAAALVARWLGRDVSDPRPAELA